MPSSSKQLENLDTELDALTTPTSAQVYAVSRDYDGDLVAASAARRAINAGGGSLPAIDSPLDLANCVAWFDASDASTINAGSPANNDPVSLWADKSPSGYDATAEAGEEPHYKSALQNGLALIRFDPTAPAEYMTLETAGDILRDVPGVTVAAVSMVQNDGGPGGVVFWVSDGDNNGLIRATLYSYGTNQFSAANDDSVDGTASTVALSYSGILAAAGTADFLALGAFSRIDVYGVGATGGFANLPPGNTPDTASQNVCIGATTTDHDGWDGYVGELVVYDRALPLTERTQLLAYLADKWGLPS